MKILCNENHWKIVDKSLILLGKDQGKMAEQVTRLEAVIEARVRLAIYEEICAIPLTDNRKAIVKNGIENALLTVQDLCAQIALGENK